MAAELVGISVVKMKYIAYAVSGFIALSAIFLGGKRPLGILLGAIVFGFAEALSDE